MGCGGSKASETKEEVKPKNIQSNQQNESPKKNAEQVIQEPKEIIENENNEDEGEKMILSTNKKKEESIFSSFQIESLNKHNELRKKHGVPPVTLNKELCDIAEKYSKYLASIRTLEHSKNKYKGESLGENIYMCFGSDCTGSNMTQAWYDEINDYNFKKPGWKSGTGHFTQVIWAATKEVGFGYSKASDNSYFAVGNYYPAGNINTSQYFEENVLPPL